MCVCLCASGYGNVFILLRLPRILFIYVMNGMDIQRIVWINVRRNCMSGSSHDRPIHYLYIYIHRPFTGPSD